ncbi:MAG TPA: MFS transporter, partial [Firmicutes bacterium]|nr:MFS transporter [Bacillota bacterium]
MSARAYLKPIALVSIITALALLGDALLYSILPLYAGSLGISTFMVGVLLSANRWVRLATNTWAARSFARWDFSGIMLAVVLLTALSTAVYAFPLGAALFFLARIIWGACYSHLRLGGYLVALKASGQSLGLALGTIQSVSRLGSIFAVLGGGLLADRFGYSWALAAAGLLSLGAVPFV